MADFLMLLESWAETGGYLVVDGGRIDGSAIISLAHETLRTAPKNELRIIRPTDELTRAFSALAVLSRANQRAVLWAHGAMVISEVSHGQASGGELVIFSSGSTGSPKPTVWTWEALLKAPRGAASEARRTIVIQYSLNCFAGIQALIYALRNGGGIYFNPGPNWHEQLDARRETAVVCILGTPSFWRTWLFGREGPVHGNPRVGMIALGGEPADQALLNRLALSFPGARIGHTYASTEFGSLFAVTDGVEGFPVSFLERPLASGQKIKIDAGELVVERDGCWRATGDLVEIRADRVIFVGRKSELVNVAGWTVSLPVVEAAFHVVEGVADIRATSRPNAVAGNVIVLNVKLAPSADAEAVREAILRLARMHLAPHERPRAIRFVDELPFTRSGKARRRLDDAKSECDDEPA